MSLYEQPSCVHRANRLVNIEFSSGIAKKKKRKKAILFTAERQTQTQTQTQTHRKALVQRSMAIQTLGQLFDKAYTRRCQLTSGRDSRELCLNVFPRTDIVIEYGPFNTDTENLRRLLCCKVKRCGESYIRFGVRDGFGKI